MSSIQVIVYTVAALSIERYIDARSKLAPRVRLCITFTSLIVIWILGILLPYPFVFYTFLYDQTKTPNYTLRRNLTQASPVLTCRSVLSERALVTYEVILYVIAFIIPYAIIVVFSLKLLKFVREWLTRKQKLTRLSVTKKRTRGVKLVLCIVLSFLLCYTPFWTFKVYTSFLLDDTIDQRPYLRRFLSYAHQVVVLLSHFEGILNPLFFIILTEHFCLTFSKHRQKHLNFLGIRTSLLSRGTERKSSILFTGRQSARHHRVIMGHMNMNGLLSSENTYIDENDKVPVDVLSH